MKTSIPASAPSSAPLRRPKPSPRIQPPTEDELRARPELQVLYTRLKQTSAARKLRFALQEYLRAGPVRGGDAELCQQLSASLRRTLDVASAQTAAERPGEPPVPLPC